MKDRVRACGLGICPDGRRAASARQAVARPSPTGAAQYGACTAGEVRTITIA